MSEFLTFLPREASFGPDELAAICAAYDMAHTRLHLDDAPAIVRETIASKIVVIASSGELDPQHLCDKAIAGVASRI